MSEWVGVEFIAHYEGNRSDITAEDMAMYRRDPDLVHLVDREFAAWCRWEIAKLRACKVSIEVPVR